MSTYEQGDKLGASNLQLVLFPGNIQDLAEEIHSHPDLLEQLAQQESQDIYVHLSDIAMFCGVVLDGNYTTEDMDKLAGILVKKLRERRTGIILLN